jgi:hypothetical protein
MTTDSVACPLCRQSSDPNRRSNQGSVECPACNVGTVPYLVSVRDSMIVLDDDVWNDMGGHSVITSYDGQFVAQISAWGRQRHYSGRGATELEAAKAAVLAWAESEGNTWFDIAEGDA